MAGLTHTPLIKLVFSRPYTENRYIYYILMFDYMTFGESLPLKVRKKNQRVTERKNPLS